MWIAVSITLALVLIVCTMNNAQKSDDIKTLQYEVDYLRACLFDDELPSRNDVRK